MCELLEPRRSSSKWRHDEHDERVKVCGCPTSCQGWPETSNETSHPTSRQERSTNIRRGTPTGERRSTAREGGGAPREGEDHLWGRMRRSTSRWGGRGTARCHVPVAGGEKSSSMVARPWLYKSGRFSRSLGPGYLYMLGQSKSDSSPLTCN